MTLRAIEEARAEISACLQTRRGEIEQATLTRIYAISDPAGASDPAYADGLRAAVSAAIDYGLASIESDSDRRAPIPPVLLVQARVAARSGVSLDTVLRRYFAGYTLLGNLLIEEAAERGLGGSALKRLMRAQAARFDRLLARVSEEYGQETSGRRNTTEQRRAELTQRLLDGELVDPSELGYEFDAFHLGLLAIGKGAVEAIRTQASSLDCRLLLIQRGGDNAWAWLGSRHELDSAALEHSLSASWAGEGPLAIGEPARGLSGWRLTHRQAAAALPVAQRSPEPIARYADVALLASIFQDDLLTTSLRQLYLAPLEDGPNGGDALCAILRAYFATGRHTSATAAALGISRQTVTKRLAAIEKRLGRSLDACSAELEAALRLRDLDPSARSD